MSKSNSRIKSRQDASRSSLFHGLPLLLIILAATGGVLYTLQAGLWPPLNRPLEDSRIAFNSIHRGWDDIFVINADGSTLVHLVEQIREDDFPTWSPDG